MTVYVCTIKGHNEGCTGEACTTRVGRARDSMELFPARPSHIGHVHVYWGVGDRYLNGACLCNEAMLTVLIPEFAFSNPT